MLSAAVTRLEAPSVPEAGGWGSLRAYIPMDVLTTHVTAGYNRRDGQTELHRARGTLFKARCRSVCCPAHQQRMQSIRPRAVCLCLATQCSVPLSLAPWLS